MKDLFEKLLDIANQLDHKGYQREADLIDAIMKNLLNNRNKDNKKTEDNEDKTSKPKKVIEDKKQIKEDAVKIRKKIVDDENIKDLFDAKEELIKLKNSGDYDLTEDEWADVYGQILEDKFKREYSDKSKEDLEKEIATLTEDRKRKGELSKEEELDYKMIDEIYKKKTHEDIRPSDKS